MRNKTTSIRRTLMDGVKQNKLVLSSHLYIITRFELTIFHVVFFHAHKSGILIRFGKAVALTTNFGLNSIFGQSRNKVIANLFNILFQFCLFFPYNFASGRIILLFNFLAKLSNCFIKLVS